jgi:N-acetylglucosamine-6-phosphate deacetylase
MTLRGRIPGKPGLWEVTVEQTGAAGGGALIASLACVDPSYRAGSCLWITPGLFDLQINGIAGTSFTNPDARDGDLAAADERIRSHGISRYCPTVITRDRNTTLAVLERLAGAMKAGAMPSAWGIHLEGPYISSEDGYRGVHRREFTRDPDWGEFSLFQEASGGRVRIVTIAPERKGSADFIRRASGSGVTVSMGHSNATPAEILSAVGAGLRMSTHLFNGCARLVDRHANPIYSQLAADELFACFIADAHHVPPAALRVGLRAKGPRLSILVSDIAHLSGLPDGDYEMEGNRVEARDGGIWVKGSYMLSGAARTLERDVEILAREREPGIEGALLMASANPSAAVGERAWAELLPGRAGPVAAFPWDGAALGAPIRIGF